MISGEHIEDLSRLEPTTVRRPQTTLVKLLLNRPQPELGAFCI
jgi:hypothetical protein